MYALTWAHCQSLVIIEVTTGLAYVFLYFYYEQNSKWHRHKFYIFLKCLSIFSDEMNKKAQIIEKLRFVPKLQFPSRSFPASSEMHPCLENMGNSRKNVGNEWEWMISYLFFQRFWKRWSAPPLAPFLVDLDTLDVGSWLPIRPQHTSALLLIPNDGQLLPDRERNMKSTSLYQNKANMYSLVPFSVTTRSYVWCAAFIVRKQKNL